jgi:hypothetical protein
VGQIIRGADCPWGELSVGRTGRVVMGQVVVGRVLMGQVVRGASFDGASGPGTFQ